MAFFHKKEKEIVSTIHTYVNKMISKRREELLNKKNITSNEDDGYKTKPALLDILLQSKIDEKPLSNDDILAEVNTFMFAGHETTGTTMGFLFYLVAKHHDVQEKLYREIQLNDLKDQTEPLTIRKINSLTYLDKVLKETLRLYPILSAAHKKCTEEIRVGNITIPANVTVITLIYANHLNERHFVNAETFNPDRWDKEINIESRSSYIYQPFSAGLRNCIGK